MMRQFVQFHRSWDDQPALLHGNRHLHEDGSHGRSQLIRWNVELGEPGEDGLPSPSEFQSLARTEDAFVKAVEQDLDAIFVGVVTFDGMREYSFYCPPTERLERRMQALWKGQGWPTEVEVSDDPSWAHWEQVLCPTQAETRLFEDAVQLSELGEDPSGPPRCFEHRVLFVDGDGADAFIAALGAGGVAGQRCPAEQDADGGSLHPVIVRREDLLELRAVHSVSMGLSEAAQRFGGEYDGWRLAKV